MGIGARIKAERERLGFTQTAFAALGEASKNSQLSWEKDAAHPNARVLSAWSAVGADVLYILTGERRPALPSSAADPAAAHAAESGGRFALQMKVSQDEAELLRHYRRCDDAGRTALAQVAKGLAK